MFRFKLQERIILLITGLSLLLISVFTYIQIQNRLGSLEYLNKLRGRLGAPLIKTSFEMLLSNVADTDTAKTMLESAISAFSNQGLVEKVSIISIEGEALATNDPLVEKFGEAKKDVETYLKLSQLYGQDVWYYTTVNEKTRTEDTYIPINIPAGLYLAKISFSVAKDVVRAFHETLTPIMITIVVVLSLSLMLGWILIKTIVNPIKELDNATRDIAAGNLERKVEIKTNDEIEDLGRTFNTMTDALRRMKAIAENANPLTKLPGNYVIREQIEKRIKNGDKFTVIFTDLDNFKAYNDRYGIGKGDEVIIFTCDVIKKAFLDSDDSSCFMGHEGGDDFILITTPEKAQVISDRVIEHFDKGIKDFYNQEDRAKGYIVAKSRQGDMQNFPIMTISLAGVTNENHPIESYGEVTNLAVSVKQKAKAAKKSNFALDLRR